VPRVVVEAVHHDQIREHGGLPGIRDENALESALSRARQRWSFEGAADLHRLAADYAFGVARNHPFRDGNKRTAFLVMVVFLGLNGLRFVASEDDVVTTMLALAAGEMDEEGLARWIAGNVRPR
jgi:death-on-curing protein